MYTRNLFIKQMNERLSHLPNEKRQRIVNRVLSDLNKIEVFTSLPSYWDLNEDEKMLRDESQAEIERPEREELIQQEQMKRNITPDTEEKSNGQFSNNPEMSENKVFNSTQNFGQTDLHRAVSMGEVEEARRLIRQDHDPHVKDNNGYTCLKLAAYSEDYAMLRMLKEEMPKKQNNKTSKTA